MFTKKVASNRPKKNSSQILIISEKRLLKAVLYYSKIFDVSFSIEFCFETKIGCFVTRLCTFARS